MASRLFAANVARWPIRALAKGFASAFGVFLRMVAVGLRRLVEPAKRIHDRRRWQRFNHASMAADEAHRLLEAGQPEAAMEASRRALHLARGSIDFAEFRANTLNFQAIIHLQGHGDLDAAEALWRSMGVEIAALIRRLGGASDDRVYLGNFWTASIGHICVIDYFVKSQLLRGRLASDIVMYVPRGQFVANRTLLDHWRHLVRFVESPEKLPIPELHVRLRSPSIFLLDYPAEFPGYYWGPMGRVHAEWAARGLPPLMALGEREMRAGKAALRAMGLPKSAWFVCLHVRAKGFKASHDDLHDHLNGDIADYLPMIDAIVARGGYVVRMGDPAMPKLPDRPGLIDYAHSPFKDAATDVFLCASCAFYVGTSSGLGYVPGLFGVRAVYTNWFPIGTRPFQPDDLYIPKKLRYKSDGALLPFAEALSPPYGHVHYPEMLDRRGIEVVPNTPQEIVDVALEMHDRMTGPDVPIPADAAALNDRFERVAQASRCHGNARIGREFLRAHSNLLPPLSFPAVAALRDGTGR